MPPAKVEIVTEPLDGRPPTKMPANPADIVPELAMPPAKVEIVTDPPPDVLPPTKMPELSADIVPELAMPPLKAEIVTDQPGRSAADPDAGVRGNPTGIADIAGEVAMVSDPPALAWPPTWMPRLLKAPVVLPTSMPELVMPPLDDPMETVPPVALPPT